MSQEVNIFPDIAGGQQPQISKSKVTYSYSEEFSYGCEVIIPDDNKNLFEKWA